MAKTDWNLRDTVRPEEMNELGQEVNEHGGKIAEQELEISEHDRTLLKQGAKITEQGESISALENRLDTEEYSEITLQPGLQVVKAERDARFRLGSIKGRTLINLLGYNGNLDSLNNWLVAVGTGSTSGRIATIIGDSSGINPQMQNLKIGPKPSLGDKFFLTTKARIDSMNCSAIRIYLYEKSIGIKDGGRIDNPVVGKEFIVSGIVTITQDMLDAWDKLKIVVSAWYIDSTAATNSVNKFWDIAMYLLPSIDYSLSIKELERKYPFTSGGITGVDNSYVMRYGENLLPPFYEWITGGIPFKLNTPYELVRKATSEAYTGANLTYKLPIIEGETYTLSYEVDDVSRAYINWAWEDASGSIINWTPGYEKLITAIAPIGAVTANIRVTGTAPGTFTFKNPMLTLGMKPKQFQPRNDSILSFQTELNSNPTDGSEPDELFEHSGQYYKLANWKKVLISNVPNWSFGGTYPGGYKYVFSTSPINDAIISDGEDDPIFVTKFNGVGLRNKKSFTTYGADCFNVNKFNRTLDISISNVDSGWGDTYTPTADEIKAYFNGWRMANPDNWGVAYPGTGTKAWGRIDKNGGLVPGSGTVVLPTFLNTEGGYLPYNLLYRLTKETVEPVVSEGCLKLNEGDNVVEVGTGIMLREQVNPAIGTTTYYEINIVNVPSSCLRYYAHSIKSIYRNSRKDDKWTIKSGLANGNERANIPIEDFDPAASYSVTYTKLDKSPIVPITGTVSTNEKAQLSDLTAGVAEALHRVSVLTVKKAEKDASGWIVPTMLNGWVRESTTFGYIKDGVGNVRLRGRISSGTIATGTVLFTLPVGMRPSAYGYYPVTVYAVTSPITTGYVLINTNGTVVVGYFPGNTWVNLDSVSFYAGN